MSMRLAKLIILPPLIGALSVGFALLPGMLVTMVMNQTKPEVLGSNPLSILVTVVTGAPIISLLVLPLSLTVCFIAHLILGLPCNMYLAKTKASWWEYSLIGYIFALPFSHLIITGMYPRSSFSENFIGALSLALVGAAQAAATYRYGQKNKPVTSN